MDDTGDLDLSGDEVSLVDGDAALAQHLLIRLRFFKGEFFLNEDIGMPYYQKILVKNPDFTAVRAIFRKAILNTPGIAGLQAFSFSLDSATRVATLTFTATKDDGEVLVFDEEFII